MRCGEGSKTAWCTRYSGIFAPASADYKLSIADKHKYSWWSAISPTREYYHYSSPDFGSRRISCIQQDGGHLPYSVPINIWTMQCLLTESPMREDRGQSMPFSAVVTLNGSRGVVVEITNHSDSPILRGAVRATGERAMSFEAVAANSSKEFKGVFGSGRDWSSAVPGETEYYPWVEEDVDYGSFTPQTAYFARGVARRTRAIEGYMQNGAVVVCVEYDRADVSFGVANRECEYNHIQLARMVVFPKGR